MLIWSEKNQIQIQQLRFLGSRNTKNPQNPPYNSPTQSDYFVIFLQNSPKFHKTNFLFDG